MTIYTKRARSGGQRRRPGLLAIGAALAAVLVGGCASGPRTGGEEALRRPTASTDADAFAARQSDLELVETGPDGESLSLRFTDLGPLDAPVVVFVHGVPTSSWMYRKAIDPVAREGVRVVAPDNVGWGTSSKPEMPDDVARRFYTPQRQAERLGRLLTALEIGRAVFVVHDVGGPIVWELLADRPELAAGVLVLNTIGAPGGFAPPAAVDSVSVQADMRAAGFERDATIRSIVCGMVGDPDEIDTPEQLEGYYRPFQDGSGLPYYAFLTSLDAIRDRVPSYEQTIGELSCPASIIWGAGDENLLAEPSVPWFADALSVPARRRIVLEDAKHLVAEEAPDRIARQALELVRLATEDGDESEGAAR
ncbi:MAG: alpha/beta fold hydrolase [Spirochaetota bacterium]